MKNKLRKTVLSQLTSQEPETKAEIDKNLLEELIALPAYKDAQVIATYLAFPHEYDTSLLIKQALKDGKRLLIPKTYKQGQMIFVDYDPDNLVATSFGLMEPASDLAVEKSEIDLIHVPGVVFNAEGYRIGYGAGYYDCYLSDFEGETVSTVYPCQEMDFIPYSHDIAVREVITCK